MNKSESIALKIQRMDFLVSALTYYNYKYYVLNNPTISDYDFDMKLKELELLEKELNIIYPYSPTQRIGSDLQSEFKEVSHDIVMGSISNVYTFDELKTWFLNTITNLSDSNDQEICIEPKYDGLSCSLIYENNILKEASTRGNGYVGSDITKNVKTIKNIPLLLKDNPDPFITIDVRGEILLPKSMLLKINNERVKEGLPPFANERNAAAGSLKQLDPKITASRNLIFKPYAIYCKDTKYTRNYLDSQSAMLEHAYKIGFDKPVYWLIGDFSTSSLLDKIKCSIDNFEKEYLHNQDFCMDGCVIKFNKKVIQDIIGFTQKVPKWAKAYKFKQEQLSTKLLKVEWQMGRTGKLTPVGYVDPIEVDGSIITKLSLNNINFITDLNLQIGAYIFISKGGAVIPKCTGVDYKRCIQENIELE